MSEITSDEQSVAYSRHGAIPGGWVKLVTYGTANEAELAAAVLGAEEIETQVFGATVNAVDWFWQVFNDVDLLVPVEDAERAKELLSHATIEHLQPADEPAGSVAPKDEEGHELVKLAEFESATELRDAQTTLASEKIVSYGPRMVLRKELLSSGGKKFVLRVGENELEAARKVLAEGAEDDVDQPRCPKCGSWRVTPRKGFVNGLASVVGMGDAGEIECDVCHHRGKAEEFFRRES